MSVAVWGKEGLLAQRCAQEGARHGTALAVLISGLLDEVQTKPEGLSAIAVSLGPGSWTGLRIGLAAGKAMAWGAGIGLVGVPSFEALALAALRSAGITGNKGLVLTVRNAYSEGLFLGFFEETDGIPRRLEEECVLRSEQLLPHAQGVLKDLRGRPVLLCGDAVCLERLREPAGIEGWRVLDGLAEVPAAVLAECAWAHLAAGTVRRSPAEIHATRPMYLRASDPELKLQRRG
jgi:tRNA threonylcarbamoyladenosine biosynthesis protein TsaB